MIPAFVTATDVQDKIRDAARQRRIALGMTQSTLAEMSGVSLGSLKRFERTGEASLTTLLAFAEALDALDAFSGLFPIPDTSTLDDIEARAKPRQRASSKGHRT